MSAALSAFFKGTLLYIRTFLLRLFVHGPLVETAPVTPYPIAPHLENCIIDIRRDGERVCKEDGDLEQDVLAPPSFVHHASHNDRARTPSGIADPASFPGHESSSSISGKIPAPPLSVITNFVRTPASPLVRHIPHRSQGENIRPVHSQTLPRPSSLKRIPRSSDLTRGSSRSSATSISNPPGASRSRRGSLVWFASGQSVPLVPGSLPYITPLKLESGLPVETVDLAARIRSVFYKPGTDDDGLETVRDIFGRDSVYSLSLPRAHFGIGYLDCVDGFEDDYGRPLSVRSMCYYTSSSSSYDVSFSSPVCLPLHPSESSALAYLHNSSWGSISALSATSSNSSATFSDLLASVERKYPGSDWTDIIQFAGDGEKVCRSELWRP
ncbi:hypothetical protein DFH07DRAFT_942771 [Mycena maculata]|uniref:Uncharacterized protein n=1 Tax=Mycena maculata TaxID=230809 RepID=A0AAD7N5Z0_9AGAR|nr:hypothetical protein DFH07DRAFT_942771 [Mycena maculata]